MNTMTRPDLHEIPLSTVTSEPDAAKVTIRPGQWTEALADAYEAGRALVEVDYNLQPIAAFRRCQCELCQPNIDP